MTLYSAPTPTAAPASLPRADWHHHSVQQPNVRRFGNAWVDGAMAECYASPAHVGRPDLVLRHGYTITDGAKRAMLYMPPGVVPSDEQVLFLAKKAGMQTNVPDVPFEPLDAATRPENKWAAQFPEVWTRDVVVAYHGRHVSECGHHDAFLDARTAFPRCEPCGRFVRWRRVQD
jgi:hypothetical protein